MARDAHFKGIYDKLSAARDNNTLEAVLNILNEIRQEFPEYAVTYNDLGAVYYQLGDVNEARSNYEKAYELDSQNSIYAKNLADLLYCTFADSESAASIYKNILELNPNDVEALIAFAHICRKFEKYDDADYFLKKALLLEPRNENALLMIKSNKDAYSTASLNRSLLSSDQTQGIQSENGSTLLGQSIVFVSNVMPRYDREAANYRVYNIIKILQDLNYRVHFLYCLETSDDVRYRQALKGVEFSIIPWDQNNFNIEAYQAKIAAIDPSHVIITNLWNIDQLCFAYRLTKQLKAEQNCSVVIDTMDCHYKKFARKLQESQSEIDLISATAYSDIEKLLYPVADLILVVSNEERISIQELIPFASSIEILSNIHPVYDQIAGPENRRHICYVGNFNADQNVDAVRYFIDIILPLIHRENPDVEFHVIGNASEQYIDEFSGDGVKIIGYVENLFEALNRYRLLVCPLTYGAGVKGKIGDAAAVGLPVVTTTVGAEGLPFLNGDAILVEDDPVKFAERCTQCLTDRNLWNHLSNRSKSVLKATLGVPAAIRAIERILGPSQEPLDRESPTPMRDRSIGRRNISSPKSVHVTSEPPLVSIVIPTYNRPEMIHTSVSSALNQTYPNCEVLVIDDGSDARADRQLQEADRRRIRYFQKRHSGIADTRNDGIRNAQGSFLVWLDDDDSLEPSAVENHLRVLETYPSSDVIYGQINFFDNHTLKTSEFYDPIDWSEQPEYLLSALTAGCVIPNPGTMVRKVLYEKFGGYNNTFSRAEDYEFWTRIAEASHFKKNPSLVVNYCRHPNQLSTSKGCERSFESLIVRNMVGRIGLDSIFAWMDWSAPDSTRAAANFMIAHNLFGHSDYYNALKFLEKIPASLSTLEILDLKLRCYVFSNHSDLYNQTIAQHNQSGKYSSDHIQALQAIGADYHQVRSEIAKQEFDQDQWHNHPMTSDIALFLAEQANRQSKYQIAYEWSQVAVSTNPANNRVFSLAQAFAQNDTQIQELRQIRKRLTNDIVEAPMSKSNCGPSIFSAAKENIIEDRSTATPLSIIIESSNVIDNLRAFSDPLDLLLKPGMELFWLLKAKYATKTKKWILDRFANKVVCHFQIVDKDDRPGKVINQVIGATQHPIILVLRDDVCVTNAALQSLLSVPSRFKKIGFWGPMTTWGASRQVINPSDRMVTCDFEQQAADYAQRYRFRRIPSQHISPFCFAFRRKVLEEIGPFDESYQAARTVMEDACLRSELAGYQNCICADALMPRLAENTATAPDDSEWIQKDQQIFSQKWSHFQADSSARSFLLSLTFRREASRFHQRQQATETLAAARNAYQYNPHDIINLQLYIELLLDAGKADRARGILASHKMNHTNETWHHLNSIVLEAIGELDDALYHSHEALKIDPASAKAINQLGILAYRTGKLEEACQYFQKAIDADPSWGDPYTNLGNLFWEAGEHEKALRQLKTGFLLSPLAANIAAAYHAAAIQLGDCIDAIEIFRENRRLFPESRRVVFLLIDLLLKTGSDVEAMAEIENAIDKFGIDDGMLTAALQVRAKLGPLKIKNSSPHQHRVSLCMIVRNEESCITRCLTSLKPIADEIIVVDTGSTDRTRELATIFGAMVFERQWSNDFAEARNYALQQASGDWILIMDADEILSPQDHFRFQQMLREFGSQPVAFSVVTRNYTNRCNIVGWTANSGSYAKEEAGNGWTPSEKVRIFPNDPDIRFSYAVHEVVGPSLQRKGIKVVACEIPIHHYGHLNKENTDRKGQKYFEIGLRKLDEIDTDEIALQELAIQAAELGRFQDAVNLWQRLIERCPNHSGAYTNLSASYSRMGNFDKAHWAAQKAVRLAPETKETHFNLALSCLHIGNAKQAQSILANLQKTNKNYYAADFMLGAVLICVGQSDAGMLQLRKLQPTELWLNLDAAFQELADSLLKANQPHYVAALVEAAVDIDKANPQLHAFAEQAEARIKIGASSKPSPRQNSECDFVVYGIPRVGSNYFISLLNKHPSILCHYETFHAKQIYACYEKLGIAEEDFYSLSSRNSDPLRFMDYIYANRQNYHAVGFNIFPNQCDLVVDETLNNRHIKKIILKRKNMVKNYISLKIARATDCWWSSKGEKKKSKPQIHFNPDEFHKTINRYSDFYQKIEDFLSLSKQKYIVIWYEDFLSDMDFYLNKLFTFLEVDCIEVEKRTGMVKQNPETIDQLVSNPQEMNAFINTIQVHAKRSTIGAI